MLRRLAYASGLFKSHHPAVPVVVVGNVVVGGAGKTPTTIALVLHLRQAGWHPGIVSRGYGRANPDQVCEVTADSKVDAAGDEPVLMAQRTQAPVFVARKRHEAVVALLRQHPGVDIIVCDDGLQHLALARDVSVVVFDDRGTGNGKLLPAGLLREPWPPSARSPWRPDLALLHRRTEKTAVDPLVVGGIPAFGARRTLAAVARSADGHSTPLADLPRAGLVAVAGIARPEAFFDMLADRGVVIQDAIALPDHAAETDYDTLLDQISNRTAPDDLALICTEKDAVKLFALHTRRLADGKRVPRIWTVGLELAVDTDFFEAFDRCLRAKATRATVARH